MDEHPQDAPGHEHDELEQLVLACLDRVEAEGLPAIDALCREHPGHAASLRARMQGLWDAGLLLEPGSPPERLGEFRLGERLGGGGMGVVYAAVQEPFEREVALKIVRADRLFFPGARERFRREVQLVARLAHSGIVPVFSVGEEQGVPYFAMERLQGATLAEALANLDEPPRQGRDLAQAVVRVVALREGTPARRDDALVDAPLFAGSGVMTCVRIVQRMAEALDHAHGRGVLHRDLKPSNLMLTKDGRALLFDFGLASSTDSARLTDSGSRVGSLAYMPPEQVGGAETDVRSDVYGLGAILCEALTLQPPHVGSAESVLAAILSGAPSDFATRRGDLPRDVETVVEKALAPAAEHRYASAAALARDLGHLLARRPIEARRAGPVLRATRWVQRQPARAGLLAVIVVAPILFAIQQSVSKDRIIEQSARADANIDRALEALDLFVWDLGTGALEHVPHLDAERLAMFEDAAVSLEQLAQQRPDDLLLRGRAVRMHAALGTLLLELGRLADAEAHYREAVALGTPGVPPADVIKALNGLGNLLEKQGDLQAALELFEEGVERHAIADYLGSLDTSAMLRNVARVSRRLDQPRRSILAADTSVTAAERALAVATTEDERFEARCALAAALNSRAVPFKGSAPDGTDPEVARAAFLRALPLAAELASLRPRRSDVVHQAAVTCVNATHYLDPVEAAEALRQGIARIEDLERDYPERVEYVRAEIALASNLGIALVGQGRGDEARVWFERASTASEPWLERESEDLTLLLEAGRADVNLAMNLVGLELRGEACASAARGAARIERALRLVPLEPRLQHELAWARIQEGYGRIAGGEFARALALAQQVPVEQLADPTIAVAVGELLAGCADLASEPAEVERLRTEALDRLGQGLKLGFAAFDYLRAAPEWASLRSDPRFEELLRKASE